MYRSGTCCYNSYDTWKTSLQILDHVFNSQVQVLLERSPNLFQCFFSPANSKQRLNITASPPTQIPAWIIRLETERLQILLNIRYFFATQLVHTLVHHHYMIQMLFRVSVASVKKDLKVVTLLSCRKVSQTS